MLTTTGRPTAVFRGVAGAISAGTLLVCLVAGLPVAMALLAGNPLPASLPTLVGIRHSFTSPDDGSLFLAVLTVVGWLAWASFTASVVLEVFARVTHRQTWAVPGFGGPQRLAALLVAAVAALAVSPTLTSSAAAPVDPAAAGMAAAAPIGATGVVAVSDRTGAGHVVDLRDQDGVHAPSGDVLHLVERGEGLLDLQDSYGVPWQRIAEANYGVAQPDGAALQRGQTRIYPGWQLRIPHHITTAHATSTVAAEASQPTGAVEAGADGHKVYEVVKDDWMWHIADRYLGDAERFADIAALNPRYADRHGDFPDHIEPGWTLRLPADAADSGPIAHAAGAAAPVTSVSAGDAAPPPLDEVPSPTEDPPPTEGPLPTEDRRPPTAEVPAPATATPPVWTPAPDAMPTPAQPPWTPAPDVMPTPVPPLWTPVPEAVATIPVPELVPTPVPDSPETAAPSDAGAAGAAGHGPEGSSDAAEESPAADEPASEDPDRLAPAVLASAGLLTALVLGAISLLRRRRNDRHEPGTVPVSAATRRLERTLRIAQQPLDAERLDAALRALAAGLATRHGQPPDIAGALITDGAVELVLYEPCPDPPEPWQARGDRWHLAADAPLPPVHGPLAPLPALATVGSQPGRHVLLDLERLGVLTLYGPPAQAGDLLRYLAAELAHNTWSDAVEVLLAGFPPAEAELLAELSPQRVRVLPSIADGVSRLRRRVAAARAVLHHTGSADTLAGRVHGVAGDAWMPQVLLAATPGGADRAAIGELELDLDAAGRCAVAVVTTAPEHLQPGGWRVTLNPDGVMHVRQPFLQTSLSMAALPLPELELLAGTLRRARVATVEPVPPPADDQRWAVDADAGAGWRRDADPDLDDDLRAWYVEDPGRPRIAVLGEVRVDAHGVPPESRRRLHAELIVYLAQRGSRGADSALLDEALWPDAGVAATTRQMIVSRARSWLGTDAGGNPWLTDVDADLAYRLAEGYLLDWHLFRRLRTRAERRGAGGADDLQAALRLVRGAPLHGADRPPAPATRNPYPWLPESDIDADLLVAAVVDVAHQLCELCLDVGDNQGVRWAVQQAWLADASRSYDQPWRDLMRAAYADGDHDQLRDLLAELMELRDAETPEDLAPATRHLVQDWLPMLAVPAPAASHAPWEPTP